MLKEASARAAVSGAVAFGTMAAIAIAPAPAAQATTSFPVAPNANHSRVLQTPLARCRAALADPNGVLVIGDSITGLGFADITAQFTAAGRPVCINARGGRRTDEGVAQLSRYVAAGLLRPATSVVMALGTNDVLLPKGGMKTNIVRASRLLGPTRHVYWVHVFNYLWWGIAPQWKYVQGTRRVGEEIQWGVRHFPNITPVQWPTLVKKTYPALLQRDRLHPTRKGSAALTRLILAAMKPRV